MQNRPALFLGRHFEDVIIILCVRWYLRYSLSYRDLEEMMAERGLSVDHFTIWRWVQRYAPLLNQRLRSELRHPNRSRSTAGRSSSGRNAPAEARRRAGSLGQGDALFVPFQMHLDGHPAYAR